MKTKEEEKEYFRKYYLKNKEKLDKLNSEYYLNNKKNISELASVYRKVNKEKIAKALEKAKIEKEIKQVQDDSIGLSKKSLQALNSTQSVTKATSTLNALVSAGTITQDQATAIQSAFEASSKNIQASGTYTNRPKNPLESLVSAGTITKEQETAVKGAFDSSMKPGRAEGKDSTATLDSLVAAGTITQAQEDSIQDSFESAM